MISLNNGNGAMIDVAALVKATVQAKEGKSDQWFLDVDGNAHIQILGDGSNVLRTMFVTNVAMRVMEPEPEFYNSFEELKSWLVTLID